MAMTLVFFVFKELNSHFLQTIEAIVLSCIVSNYNFHRLWFMLPWNQPANQPTRQPARQPSNIFKAQHAFGKAGHNIDE